MSSRTPGGVRVPHVEYHWFRGTEEKKVPSGQLVSSRDLNAELPNTKNNTTAMFVFFNKVIRAMATGTCRPWHEYVHI
jgi:hypothetical protein